MTNRGLLPGLIQPTWQGFRPRIRAFSTTGAGITQPSLANSRIESWFEREASGKVHYYGGIIFGAGATFGTGETVWGIELPMLANRSSNAADLPLGIAYGWQGSVSSRISLFTPTLLDPLGPYGRGGEENRWLQLFNGRLISAGTGTIASGATSVTLAHGLGHTPVATDFRVVPTAVTTNNCGLWYVDTITPTSFNVNVKSNPGASGFAFGWKAEADPNGSSNLDLLVARNKPWPWTAGMFIGWNVVFEGRR